MRRYHGGDREALAILIDRHKTCVFSYVYHKLNSALAADEISQEVFLTMAEEARSAQLTAGLRVRLYKIALGICQTHPIPPLKTTSGAPESSGLQHFGLLIGDELDVLLLKEIALLHFSEIGEVLSLREGAVKLLLQSGLRRLQNALRGLEAYENALKNFRTP